MQMREQDAVNPPKLVHVNARGDANQRADPVAKHGIGEESDSVELDQSGGVPHPCDRRARHRDRHPYLGMKDFRVSMAHRSGR